MIRTVLGDTDTNQKGNVLMHEHIMCTSNDMLFAFGNKWLDLNRLEAYAVSILSEIKSRYGINVFVDGTAVDLGRNAKLLKRISEKTGVHIVASTGLYYYPAMVSCIRSTEELSEWFLYECEKGMEGTDIKPGILKCAFDGNVTEDMRKRVEALSVVQAKTDLPMYAHCSHNDNIAFHMIDIFKRTGANPQKIILGHASRRLDATYLTEILKEGFYICIDQSFGGEENKVAETVYRLCERGYEKKILFSHDRPIYNDFSDKKGTGIDFDPEIHIERYGYTINKVVPELKKLGLTQKHFKMFLNNNPFDALSVNV